MDEQKSLVADSCFRSAFLEWLLQADTKSALYEILTSLKTPDQPDQVVSVSSPIQSPRAEPLPLMTLSKATDIKISPSPPVVAEARLSEGKATDLDLPPTAGTTTEVLPSTGTDEIAPFYVLPTFFNGANRGFTTEAESTLRKICENGLLEFEQFEAGVVQQLWGLSQYMALVLYCQITGSPVSELQELANAPPANIKDLTYDQIAAFWTERHLSMIDPSTGLGGDWNFYAILLERERLSMLPPLWENGPKTRNYAQNGCDEYGLPYIRLQTLSPFIREVVYRHKTVDFLRNFSEFQNSLCETMLLKCVFELSNGVKHGLRSTWGQSDPAGYSFTDLSYSCLNEKWWKVKYEEFYVVYCMFFNLDSGHRMMLDRQDLVKYNHWTFATPVVSRIFQESGPLILSPNGIMKYEGFLLFVMLDEDKSSDTAIEYWFQIVDTDGDGFIQKYEIEYFYQDQHARLISRSMDPPPLDVVFCQLADMIKPQIPFKISISDLKRQRKNATLFFNTLLSLTKFLAWEHRDPFSAKAEILEDWERWCRLEYERLATDDGQGDEAAETLEISGGSAY